MLDTFKLYNDLKQTMDERAAETIVQVLGVVYEEVHNTVTKAEFNEMKEVVHDLAEAQKRIEQRVEELALAQARTEEKVEELSVGLRELQKAMTLLARQVGGLSDAVGGDIEDIAYIVLRDVLQREYGWKVGVLERTWQNWGRKPEEVNIFGQATDPARPGDPIWIVGEAKHNLMQSDVSRFARQLERARQNLSGEIYPVCFCFKARPEAEADRCGRHSPGLFIQQAGLKGKGAGPHALPLISGSYLSFSGTPMPLRLGYGGRVGGWNGFFLSSSRTYPMAVSS